MELERTVRVQGSTWVGRAAFRNAGSGSGQGQPHPYDRPEARTPQEALAHIDRLYKAGRMEDLPALLRRSQVFREAWLMLQTSSPDSVQTVADQAALASSRRPSSVAPPPPVPSLGSPRRGLKPEAGPETVQEGEGGASSKNPHPARDVGVTPGSMTAAAPLHIITAALRTYQTQESRYAREKEPLARISLRV
jgi:hypothetical protein